MTRTHLLIVGNSGVGKSFIGNALLQRESFRSSFEALSVTTSAQTALLAFSTTDGVKHEWVLVDMPGLMEADSTNHQRNEQEMAKAFATAGNNPVIVAFVLTLEGGRMRAEHVAMVQNVLSSVSHLGSSNAFVVVNRVDDVESMGDEIRSAVSNTFPMLCRTVLVPYFNVRARKDLTSTLLHENVFSPFLSAALACTPTPIRMLSTIRADALAAERDRINARLHVEAHRMHLERLALQEQRQREAEEQKWREAEQRRKREEANRLELARIEKERLEEREREDRRRQELQAAAEQRRREAAEEARREAAAEERRQAELQQMQMQMALRQQMAFQQQMALHQLFGGGNRRGRGAMFADRIGDVWFIH